jgi:hypothetical protein
VTTVLIILAALTAYVVFVLASPATDCRTCRGWGTKGRHWRRRGTCHRCGGTGIRFRPGAPLIYRAAATYRRSRANGDLTTPPWRPPRNRRTPHDPEGENRP